MLLHLGHITRNSFSTRNIMSVTVLLSIIICIIYYTLGSEITANIPGIASAILMATPTLIYKNNPESLNVSVSNRLFHVHFYNPPTHFRITDAFLKCHSNCSYSVGKVPDYFDKDAVVFWRPQLDDIPIKKRKGQVWVLHDREPMVYDKVTNLKAWNSLFNWTMAYRRDADVISMYGRFKRSNNQDKHIPNMVSKFRRDIDSKKRSSKSKRNVSSTAWFVSHCNTQSKREDFVEILNNTHSVDIYGHCGTLTCAKQDSKCFLLLNKQYKFYLSFENSLCIDYISEKSFKLYRDNVDVIPITRGFPNMYPLYLPPGSYIDTSHFNDTKQLGQFLNKLGRNRSRYLQYFQWRRHYQAYPDYSYNYWCALCDRLHKPDVNTKYQRIYSDIYRWVFGSSNLTTITKPTDIIF